jgi:hypothetical protein
MTNINGWQHQWGFMKAMQMMPCPRTDAGTPTHSKPPLCSVMQCDILHMHICRKEMSVEKQHLSAHGPMHIHSSTQPHDYLQELAGHQAQL